MSASETSGGEPSRQPRRHGLRILIALSASGLVAAHMFVLYRVSTHVTVSAGLLAAGAIVLCVKHLGLFGSAYRLYRSRFQRKQLQ